MATYNAFYVFDATDFSALPRTFATSKSLISMVFSPTNPNLLITTEFDPQGRAEVWDVETGKVVELVKLVTHPDEDDSRIFDLSFSADGTKLAFATPNSAGIVKVGTWERQFTLLTTTTQSVNISRDGTLLALAGRLFVRDQTNEVVIFPSDDPTNPTIFDRDGIRQPIYNIAITEDNTRVAIGDTRGNIQSWLIASGERTSFIRGEGTSLSNANRGILFAPTGESLISIEGNPRGVLRVYALPDLQQIDVYTVNNNAENITDAEFSTSGAYIALATNAGVQIIDAETLEPIVDLVLKR